MSHILQAIKEHQELIQNLEGSFPLIEQIAQKMIECLNHGGTIFWMGNGGSAADSQHLASELVGRFSRERKGLASIALTTDPSILTSVSNDYGYDQVFSRQIEALVKPQDMVFGLSTSGTSPNTQGPPF